MKVRINITIDQEAVNILNEQENKSQYIEDLILNRVTEQSILTEQRVIELIKEHARQELTTADKFVPEPFVPRPPDPITGYPCCVKKSPCKHWAFDQNMFEWVNSITGNRRDADE